MLWKPQTKVPSGDCRTSVWCSSTESEDPRSRVSRGAALEWRGSSDSNSRIMKKVAMAESEQMVGLMRGLLLEVL